MVDFIYCAGSNKRLMQAAADAGWLLGVRSDRSSYGYSVAFVDNDYKKECWDVHLRRVMQEKPRYATVPDLSESICDMEDIKRALAQGDQLAAHCEIPLIIPKLSAQLAHIPSRYAIAYSVPSTYGGAKFGPWLLAGRRVHLLGGSPSMQRKIYRSLQGVAEVVSVDGNMAQKVGLSKLNYWSKSNVWKQAPRGSDPYACIALSFDNIRRMWLLEKAV